ncbi:helix-turn-helix domain-containing protein [Isoptericola sp. b515]|uniref:helix-turn-helix domain-containing protein n=1 Tax=Isoptericola sp. b515 TaxID=3064652 RepID=UPI002712254A|nr:helix-turn-helix domain-containing protein [Isoptericola sp. b515]MDO8147352.1 helix-turn-helix domain-containing protein [Isoptericola sp. b515]
MAAPTPTAPCPCSSPDDNPDRLMSVPEWCAYWGIGEPFTRKLIRLEKIYPVRLGRRVFLPKSEGNAVIARNTDYDPMCHFR